MRDVRLGIGPESLALDDRCDYSSGVEGPLLVFEIPTRLN